MATEQRPEIAVNQWDRYRGYQVGVGRTGRTGGHVGVIRSATGEVLWTTDPQTGPGSKRQAGELARQQVDRLIAHMDKVNEPGPDVPQSHAEFLAGRTPPYADTTDCPGQLVLLGRYPDRHLVGGVAVDRTVSVHRCTGCEARIVSDALGILNVYRLGELPPALGNEGGRP